MEEDKNISNGESSKMRSTSECSSTNEDGSSEFTRRRQRTTSLQFMVESGLVAASPPKFVSLEEIMQAANGMRDMALVHQIVVDKDFRLKRAEPEPNSVQGMIKNTMHKAFWDILRQQLNNDPPEYTQAFNLLEEIKEGLFSVLLPQHTKIRQQISEVLDSDLIKQQAENGTLDFKNYANYVISVMAKLCAPIRDDKIRELGEVVDVLDTFKGILETLDLMQLDMANFTLQMVRPDIIACSVELERKKFADYLAIQNDGLRLTRKWLLRFVNTDQAVPDNVQYESLIKSIIKRSFCQACVELIDWPKDEGYPETFMLDLDRLNDLHTRYFRLICAATIILVTISNSGTDLQSISAFKQSLKDHICILLQDIKDEDDFKSALRNISEQVIIELKEAQKKYELPQIAQAAEINLKEHILDIGREDHKVKELVQINSKGVYTGYDRYFQRIMVFFSRFLGKRVKDFMLETIESSTAAPQKVPSGLTALQKELMEIAGQFLRIVSHNNTVFCNYYYDIVAAALPKPN